jgi:DMSO reductase anchor subunit
LNGKYLRASIKLFREDGFLHQVQSSALYDGVYYGMLLLFILLNLLLYSRLKIKVYFAYSALLASIFLLFASGQGWLTFLLPNLLILETITTNSLAMLLALASAAFAKQYLNIETLSPKINRLLTALQRVVLILLIAKLTLNDYLPQPLYFTAYGAALLAILLIFIGCTVAAVIGIQNNQREALYYLWTTIVFFVTAIVMGISAAALIKLKFSWQLLQLASIFEVLIFSLGLFGISQRHLNEKKLLEEQLNATQSSLVKQLEFSNSLKDTILTNTVEPALFPELAKITQILP